MKILSRMEELVLLAVWKLKEDAYGVPIRKHINSRTGTEWSVGAVYVPLDRLTKWGYLETVQGEPTPERGGRSKRFYRMTNSGFKALEETKKVNENMWNDLPDYAADIQTGEK
ncbi:PadR family transcriptional regulator [candidate division KSB1 bacterium]